MDDSSDSDAPPRTEQEYLAQRVKELERTHRRWKLWILAAVAAAFLFLLLTAGFISLRVARARAAEMLARQAAEQMMQQLEAERQALRDAEAARQAEAAKQKERGR
jgi:hypothetical protein